MKYLSQVINHPELGVILLKHNIRIKRLSIKVTPKNEIIVNIPAHYTDIDEALRFIEDKKSWIKKATQRQISRKKIYTESLELVTKNHSLTLKKHSQKNIIIQVENNKIFISYPETIEVSNSQVQNAIEKAITHAIKIEAYQYLPKRIVFLAKEHKLLFNKLTLRDQKTRWGSCSHNDNISLSIRLMLLPEHLSDYVILHELAHTKHKNHGPMFWKFLNSLCNNKAIELRRELKNYSLQ